MRETLVLAVGNTLRGDDGVGHWIAARLQEDPDLADRVEVESVHQLLLEHADRIAQFSRVLFLDAHVPDEKAPPIRVAPVVPNAAGSVSSHHLSPETLLEVARRLYGAQTEGWIVSVRAEQFEIGAELSPRVRQAAEQALKAIRELIQTGSPSTPQAESSPTD